MDLEHTSLAHADAYLSHHGILGMRWGIRRFQNNDGTLTSAGKKRYLKGFGDSKVNNTKQKAVHKIIENSSYKEDISKKVFTVIGADKAALGQANNEINECMIIEKKITSEMNSMLKGLQNDEERHYYYAVSEIAACMDGWKKPEELTIADVCDAAYEGLFEDGQQSNINANSMYTYKNHLESDVRKVSEKVDQIREKRKTAENIVQKAINDAGGEDLTISPTSKYNISNYLVNRMYNGNKENNWKNCSGTYDLTQALYAQDFGKTQKDAIATAEKIASNLKNNRDKSNWYYFRQAADALGLDQKIATELTQSDWNRINAKIRKIRARDTDYDDYY